MRKIYRLAALCCFGFVLTNQNIAQTVSDFENLTLSPNSYWDGSDMSGAHNAGIFSSTFISSDAIYPNVYDTSFGAAFGYWSTGFAYSNMTDSVTSGSGNLFSARAGSGVNTSSNYIISTNNSIIRLSGAAANNTVNGCYVTNGTYAANSMRDGDAFAKQFGGVSGNDADWFKLTIWGYISGNLTTDSVEFYLADYRFNNNAQDYIIEDWNWVDLTSLGAIDSVIFVLSSTDNGSFGMNTPAYFAIDNFNDQSVSTNDLAKEIAFSIYPNPTQNSIHINLGQTIELLQLIDVTGKVIYSQNNISAGTTTLSNFDGLQAGAYFIKLFTDDQVKVERIIKQ